MTNGYFVLNRAFLYFNRNIFYDISDKKNIAGFQIRTVR